MEVSFNITHKLRPLFNIAWSYLFMGAMYIDRYFITMPSKHEELGTRKLWYVYLLYSVWKNRRPNTRDWQIVDSDKVLIFANSMSDEQVLLLHDASQHCLYNVQRTSTSRFILRTLLSVQIKYILLIAVDHSWGRRVPHSLLVRVLDCESPGF